MSESLSKKVKTWVLVVLGVRASTHAAAVARAPTSRTSSQPKTHNNALHPKPHHPHHPTSKPNQTNETIKVDTKAETLTLLSLLYHDEYEKIGGEWKIRNTRSEFKAAFFGSYASGVLEALVAGHSVADAPLNKNKA